MDFQKLLQFASVQQNDKEKQIKEKIESKPKPVLKKLNKEKPSGVKSASVKAFLQKLEKQEKEKEIEALKRREALLEKRKAVNHEKTAKAMANRTKANLHLQLTKDKLDQYVAKEKERQEKQLEKEERKIQRKLEKQKRASEGYKRKRRTKVEIAQDKGQSLEMPKPDVGVKVKSKPKPRQGPPPLDFNALLKVASEKQKNPANFGKNAEHNKGKLGRPMTQEEKERYERTNNKEYQRFLKYGGTRPNTDSQKPVPSSSAGSSASEDNSSGSTSPSNNVKEMKINSKSSESIVNYSSKKVPKKPERESNSSSKPTSSKSHKKNALPSADDIKTPEPSEVNETVIQCGPSKLGPDDRREKELKRRREDAAMNPFDRIISRFEKSDPPPEKRSRGRAVIESESEEDDEYDSEMDDFIDDGDAEEDVSSAIRDIFGYDKRRYKDEDDDCDNMEASYATMMREEAISAKIGLREDLEDIRREEEELKMKAARKKMKAKQLKRR